MYCCSNYTFDSDYEWTAIEKADHVEAFSFKYLELSHVQMIFGKEKVDKFYDVSEKNRIFCKYAIEYEQYTVRYHLMNGDYVYLKEEVFISLMDV